jgi:hypothetical protein
MLDKMPGDAAGAQDSPARRRLFCALHDQGSLRTSIRMFRISSDPPLETPAFSSGGRGCQSAVTGGEVGGEFSYSLAGLRWSQDLDVVGELEQLTH